MAESRGALAWIWTKILVAVSPDRWHSHSWLCSRGGTAQGCHKTQARVPGFGGLLGAVERVEETGEGLGVGREISHPRKSPITLLTTSALRG